MQFKGSKGEEISTLEDWAIFGKPAAEHHWADDRSAKELARYWLDPSGREKIARVLELQFPGIELVEGTAEKQTSFDAHGGRVRNHDLLVVAASKPGTVVVGVEGKADESFDKPLWKQRNKTETDLEKNERSRSFARLDDLTKLFLDTPATEITEDSELGDLGYQLLTALAGTLADAKKSEATAAVFLVHEFKTSKTDDSKHAENARVFEDFVALMGADKSAARETSDGWITPLVTVEGDGVFMPDSLPVSFAKVTTNIRS